MNMKFLKLTALLIIFFFCFLDSRNVNLENYQIEYWNMENSNYRWDVIASDKVKKETEKKYGISLPDVNYEDEYIYLWLWREILDIEYSLIVKYTGSHQNDDAYPGTVILSNNYESGKIYIYIGDKWVPLIDCNTTKKIVDKHYYKIRNVVKKVIVLIVSLIFLRKEIFLSCNYILRKYKKK